MRTALIVASLAIATLVSSPAAALDRDDVENSSVVCLAKVQSVSPAESAWEFLAERPQDKTPLKLVKVTLNIVDTYKGHAPETVEVAVSQKALFQHFRMPEEAGFAKVLERIDVKSDGGLAIWCLQGKRPDGLFYRRADHRRKESSLVRLCQIDGSEFAASDLTSFVAQPYPIARRAVSTASPLPRLLELIARNAGEGDDSRHFFTLFRLAPRHGEKPLEGCARERFVEMARTLPWKGDRREWLAVLTQWGDRPAEAEFRKFVDRDEIDAMRVPFPEFQDPRILLSLAKSKNSALAASAFVGLAERRNLDVPTAQIAFRRIGKGGAALDAGILEWAEKALRDPSLSPQSPKGLKADLSSETRKTKQALAQFLSRTAGAGADSPAPR